LPRFAGRAIRCYAKRPGEAGLDNFTRDGDANWRAQGGALVADKGNGGFVSKQAFGDYRLRIELFPDNNTNSGIYLR
jgi:hypothetical protein